MVPFRLGKIRYYSYIIRIFSFRKFLSFFRLIRLKNPTEVKAISRHEVLCTLEDVVREGAKVLKPGGRMYMVHRPHRLIEIFGTMKQYKLEPKRMKMVHPFKDKDANMVLIEAVRGGGAWMKVEAPVIVYKEPGVYTDEIYSIYGY